MWSLKKEYHWLGMTQDVMDYIRACPGCQQSKVEAQALTDLLQPLPVPEGLWLSSTIDFRMLLPKSGKHDAIMVVVDDWRRCRISSPQT
jgi:integrase-like protein